MSMCMSCKSKRLIRTGNEISNKDDLISIVNNHNVDYQTYAASAKIKFKSEIESGSARTHIRVKKDSLVWLQLKKWGFEVARILINPDSVYIVYKLDRSYEKGSIEDLSRAFNLELDFNKLQTFLIGNTLPPDASRSEYENVENGHFLYTQSGPYIVDYFIDKLTSHVTQFKIKEGRDREVTITYDDYRPISEGGLEFSYFRKYVAEDESSLSSIEIDVSSVEFNKQFDIRFEIPSHYYKL